MSFKKIITIFTVGLFGFILITYLFKGDKNSTKVTVVDTGPIEIDLEDEIFSIEEEPLFEKEIAQVEPVVTVSRTADENLPEGNAIAQLFNTYGKKLPFVETVIYKSRTSWLKDRAAWLADYASWYKTSRHFIARSLNGKADYNKQNVANGDRFNVFKKDYDVEFYLVIDVSRCKMWFYSWDKEISERTLLKTYKVGLGRVEEETASGFRTPLGRYTLGEKIGVYNPKSTGFFRGEKIEMMRVFGTRWLPLDGEYEDATEPARGLGIHGIPWKENDQGVLAEAEDCIGKYQSAGCTRLKTEDIEEIFSIVISKPTTVEFVRDFCEAHLPGNKS